LGTNKDARNLILVVLILAAVFAVAACGAPESSPATAPDDGSGATEDLPGMTLEELSAFNGKDGQPAYIAVDGIVYDVSAIPQWRDGEHNSFFAGNDLTEEIKTVSPHGTSKLTGLPVVGKLVP